MSRLNRWFAIGAMCVGAGMLNGCAEAIIGGAAAGAAVVHDRRSAGTVVDDQIIEFRVIEQIYSDSDLLNKTHVSVTSYNKIVLLTGEAPSEELRARAEQRAAKIADVRRIHNEIALAEPSSVLERSSDTWTTAKVKAAMFGIKDRPTFDATRIKVVTSRGTVYLLGLVTSDEAATATESARRVAGVKRVVKIFEVIE